MTGGGATQLTLSGGQDKYLHLSAVSGFFDSQHISYEDFAQESILVDSQGNSDFQRLAKHKFIGAAELANGAYLETTMPEITAPTAGGGFKYYVAWVHCIGLYLYRRIEFNINSNKVDECYPQFLDLWGRLTISGDKRKGYNDMIGEINFHTSFSHNHIVHPNQVDAEAPQYFQETKKQFKILLPIQLWWTSDHSQALPVGILLFADIYINVEFEEFNKLYLVYSEVTTPGPTLGDVAVVATTISKASIVDSRLYVDYIFMSNDSRERIANKDMFYVIKQVKSAVGFGGVPVSAPTYNYRLPFVMPVTSIIFGVQEEGAVADGVKRYDWWDRYAGNHSEILDDGGTVWNDTLLPSKLPDPSIENATLKILAQDRFENRGWLYWNRYIPFRHNTCVPESRGVYVFHFALYPEQHLASGAVNLSHADNNYLYIKFNRAAGKDGHLAAGGIGTTGISGQIYIYAVSHNYLFVSGGYLTVLYNA